MTQNQQSYNDAMAKLPPKVRPGFNPQAVSRPDWRGMTADEAREWLTKELFG